jgi:type III secretion system FlhB-like substrate exporter
MFDDIQEDVAAEQVEQEPTQVVFGQGDSDDTQSDSSGQVENSEDFGSWEQDKRYDSYWGKDPNKMFGSLRYLEKQKSEYEKFKSDYDTLKNETESYKKKATDYDQLEELFSRPEYADKLSSVFNDNTEKTTNSVAPENVDLHNELNNLRSSFSDIMEWKNSLTDTMNKHYESEQAAELLAQKNAAYAEIQETCKTHNVHFPEENKATFEKMMIDQKIPPNLWGAVFTKEAMSTIQRNAATKGAENAMKRNVNSTSFAPNISKSVGNTGKGQSFAKQIDSIFGG